MGLDALDMIFRLEMQFGIKLPRGDLDALIAKNDLPDFKAGELFDLVRAKAFVSRFTTLDAEADAEVFWPLFQQTLSDALGVDPGEIAKDSWIIRELGVG